MIKLFFVFLAGWSLNSFAQIGTCEIYYSSLEQNKMSWMNGSKDNLKDATLEECVTHAERMLGERQQWKTFIRKDIRKITHARYKFNGETLNASGELGLPDLEH